MIPIEELHAQLTLIPKSDWADLFKHLPGLRAKKEKERDKALSSIVDQAYYMQLIVSFDWGKWSEGRELLNSNNKDYSALDEVTLVKMLTTVVRSERFLEGSLKMRVEDGTLEGILNALMKKFGGM